MRKYASYNLVLEMFICIKMDAESNETTPAILVPLFHEDIYIYVCIYTFMYNMHVLNKITLQVSRNVHILMRETFTHKMMNTRKNETTPTIPC